MANRNQGPGNGFFFALGIGLVLLAGIAALGGIVGYEASIEARPTESTRSETLVGHGRVLLDIEGARLTVSAGSAPGVIRVEGDYDDARLALVTGFVDGNGDAPGWTYRVRLHGRGLVNPVIGKQIDDNRLTITLPPDLALTLEGELEHTHSRLSLGGMSLESADLELLLGQYTVDFAEPTAAPLTRLALNAPSSELELQSLGNASPRTTVVRKKLGPARIDLRGAWRGAEAVVEIDCGVGDCDVTDPAEAGIPHPIDLRIKGLRTSS
ncbi:hypothetical protein ABI59_16275 [Acidobacteria bacterium Mor1]|nr:hypothetical protein ABI59_16275 [Acidobacteria bacterium Mor1]